MNDPKKTRLSLAQKAGKVKAGEFMVRQALDRGEAFLVIVDSEASDATKNRWINACKYKNVPFIAMEAAGKSIGKENVMTICVTSSDFARMILDLC